MLLARPSRLLFKPPRAVGASVQLPTPRSCLCTETPSTLQTRASALTVVSLFAQRRVAPSLVTFSVRRHVSTTSAPPSPAAATDTSNPSASADAASNETALTWNRFLQLRAIRRRFNLVASLVSSAGTVTAGAAMLAALDLDAFSAQVPFGLDPVLALGLCTAGCGALGWLFGPFAGNALFGWWYRGLRREIGAVSRTLAAFKQFLHRLRNCRFRMFAEYVHRRKRKISIIV